MTQNEANGLVTWVTKIEKEVYEAAVDNIYASIKTQTCTNCRHWYSQVIDHPNYRICNNSDLPTFMQDCHWQFGCNKWEPK